MSGKVRKFDHDWRVATLERVTMCEMLVYKCVKYQCVIVMCIRNFESNQIVATVFDLI